MREYILEKFDFNKEMDRKWNLTEKQMARLPIHIQELVKEYDEICEDPYKEERTNVILSVIQEYYDKATQMSGSYRIRP